MSNDSPRPRPLATRVFGEPLVWFFLVGGALFALGHLRRGDDTTLHLSRASLDAIAAAAARRAGVSALAPPAEAQLRARAVDDELLYRDGLRLGVDKQDNIVRQRVIEKMRFLAEDLAGDARPVDDTELERYLRRHEARYRQPATLSFVHVFARDPAPLARLRPSLRAALDADAATPPDAGEPFPSGRVVLDTPVAVVARDFGGAFADGVAALAPGEWSAPLRSAFGFHLVKLLRKHEPSPPSLAEIRNLVRNDYLSERKASAGARFMRDLRSRYQVVIDDAPGALDVPAAGALTGDAKAD